MITNQELKQIFIKEHRRDIRLTVIGAILNVLGAVVVLTLLRLAHMRFDKLPEQFSLHMSGEWIAPFIISLTIIIVLLFSLRNLFFSRRRMELIDKCVEKIENNEVALNISQTTEYRICIHLIKIKIQLGRVDYAVINFQSEKKAIKLPFPAAFLADLKTMVSGVSLGQVKDALNDLYANPETERVDKSLEFPDYNLKSSDEFKKFVQEELSETIENLEKKRKTISKKNIIMLIVAVIVAIAFVSFSFLRASNFSFSSAMIIYVLLGASSFVYYILGYKKKLKSVSDNVMTSSGVSYEFKTKIFKKIIEFIHPSLSYALHGHLSLPEFLETGIFQEKNYEITGNDQIIGSYKQVPFQTSDITVTYMPHFSKENARPDEVVAGQVFVAKFNKTFKETVFILPRKNASGYVNYDLGEKVKLEDPEFMKMFDVYAKDQIEARYILSTSLMERLKETARMMKGGFYVSFKNNRISILNDTGGDRFELSINESITKKDLPLHFYNELRAQLGIIEELKLNQKIWK